MLTYKDETGSTEEFEKLLMGRKTILLFVRNGCKYCDNLLDYWRSEVGPYLDTSATFLICLQSTGIPESVARLGSTVSVIYPDSAVYREVGIRSTPTIVGLDEYGFATYLKVGFGKKLDSSFFDIFAMRAKK